MYQLHIRIPGIKPKPLPTEAMSWYISVHTEVIVNCVPSFGAVSNSQWLQTILCMEWENISIIVHKHKTPVGKLRKQRTTAPVDRAMYCTRRM